MGGVMLGFGSRDSETLPPPGEEGNWPREVGAHWAADAPEGAKDASGREEKRAGHAARELRRQRRAEVPPEVPGHELLRVIGKGAYGEVWLARAKSGGYHAVKVVWREDFRHGEFYEQELLGTRFYEPLSRDNYGLVPILMVGQHEREGQEYFYCVMELADDSNSRSITDPATYRPRTLQNAMSRYGRRSIPLDPVLGTGVHLAHGLCCLHDAGLTHGDIKPSNIVFIHSQPRLTDAGMVSPPGKLRYAGTTGYIPPEGAGSKQADVYALAMVLYEMATGYDRLEFPSLPPGLPEGNERWLAFNRILCAAADPVHSRRSITSALQLGRRLEALRHPRVFPPPESLPHRLATLALRALPWLVAAVMLALLAAWFLLPEGVLSRLPEAWEWLMTPPPGSENAPLPQG